MSASLDSGAFTRVPAWHREGVVLDDFPQDWDEMRVAAGLDWEPEEVNAYGYRGINTRTGKTVYAPGPDVEGDYYVDTTTKKIIHGRDGNTLGYPRDHNYTLITHDEYGQIIEATELAAGTGKIRWESAGSVLQGRQTWALALLDEPIEHTGDFSTTMPFLALTNRHDALGGCSLRATGIRIVCKNTFDASELEGKRTGTVFSFTHSRNWKDRMDEAVAAVTGARRQFRAYADTATELLGIPVTDRQRELFVREFFPTPPDGIISKRVGNNIEASRQALRTIYDSETTEPVKHTVYGLVAGAGEYLDHVRRSRDWETRLNRTILNPEPQKAKAVKLALSIVKEGEPDRLADALVASAD